MPEKSNHPIENRILGSAVHSGAVLGAVLGAASLFGFAALACAASGASSPRLLVSSGAFLIGAFSWASLFVPLWLALASLMAILPGWNPSAFAALVGSWLPFAPIVAIARLSASPELFFSEHPALAAVGMPALFVAALAIAIALSALVLYFSRTLSRSIDEPSALRPAKYFIAALPAPRELPPPEAEARVQGSGDSIADFPVPNLPPLPPFISLGEVAVKSPASDIPPPPSPEPAAKQEPAVKPEPVVEPSSVSAPPAPAPKLAAKPAAEGSGPIAEALVETRDGGTIEFVSVMPEHRQDAQSIAAEAEKAAAVAAALERVRARRKDKPYAVPVEGILTVYPDGEYWIIDDKTRHSAEILRQCLAEFKIEAEVTGIRKGPVITMFEILPAPGVKLSKITNLSDNIALRLAASSVRIVAPIPGKHAVGIEVPNERRSIVSLRELIEAESFKAAKMEIPVVLGKDIAGEAKFIDLAATPHLLIAGATGSGKSVCVNAMILSILFRRSPQDVKLLLIDPKIVELKLYNDIPHLLTPVITEPKRAFQALQYCICEMERRYSLLDHAGVRDIKSYNRKIRDKGYAAEKLPYIVVVIDEFADLMATTGKELESTLARLAAMSRAIGIHLVLATQRPSIDVITGLIKANIPSRIAFMVASKFDSRIIIDAVGAEKLLGKGDMLVATVSDPFPIREQGAFVSEEEVERAVEFVKTLGEPEYIDDEIFIDEEDEDGGPSLFNDEDDDPLYQKALEIVLQQGKASASYIQRRLKIGYNRASRLVELMEDKGIVGPANGSKPRDIVRNPEVLGARGSGASRSEAARQASLLPGLETVPGQRVTGHDEDEPEEDEE
jgi:S-DNA-T family DNA segregation ATPase FtsK/SpoIIIE